MDIKPIETRYKGYRFRSRLEARWAVFFDALGVRWEYEKEGYELPKHYLEKNNEAPDTLHYLPDFYLPELKLFVEVKGGSVKIEEFYKAMRLSLYTKQRVLIVKNIPSIQDKKLCVCENAQEEYYGHLISANATTDRFIDGEDLNDLSISHDVHVYFIYCPKNKIKNISNGIELFPLDFIDAETFHDCGTLSSHFNNPVIINAYEKARSARFEHGE